MNGRGTQYWIMKAESDLKTGKDEFATVSPATDAVCFHMQQCVEKYLKAFIIFNKKEIRKTHDITELIELCTAIEPDFNNLYQIKADRLTEYAIELRYPSEILFPSLDESRQAIEIAEKVKVFVLNKLKNQGFIGL
ncbi:MAG: HEPN domain-containing protein [Candidatus Hydrogenedentota bacterium]